MSRMDRRAVIGRKFPYAYIRKIVLESDSNYSQKNVGDPHLKKEKNKLDSDPILRGKYTTTTMTLILKDGAYKNSHGQKLSWLNRDSYKKNTVITVVQFESKEAEKYFIKNIKKILREKKSVNGATMKQVGLHEIYGLENKPMSYILRRTKNNNKNKNKITYSIPYRIKFASPASSSYLSYIAFVHARNRFERIGKITNSIVLDRGRPMETCKVLYTPNNKLWAGATHSFEGGLYTGLTHKPSSKSLRISDIPNKKIVDLRNIDKLVQPEKISSTSREDKFMANKNSSEFKRDIKNIKVSYFTDLFMTPHQDGTNNLFFGIDMRKIIRDNSPFGSLFDYPSKNNIRYVNRMEKILLESRILSFSLQRRKILKSSTWSEGADNIKLQDRDVLETIVESRDVKSTNSRILQTRTHRVDIPQESSWIKLTRKCGSVREISNLSLVSNNNIGFRFFSITDNSSKVLEQGEYQYLLHLNIQDGTVKYIKRRAAALRSIRRKLSQYLEEASKRGSYDSLYETFTKQFKISQRQKYRPEKRPWILAVGEYVSILELFRTEDFNATQLTKKLLKLCDLETGTPEGISILIKMIDDFLLSIQRKIGTNISLNKAGKNVTSTTGNLTSLNGRTSVSRSVIELTREFKEIYKPAVENDAGYEYLETAGNNSSLIGAGIKTISYDEFSKRILEENRKYFSKEAIDGTNNNIDIRIETSKGKEEIVLSAADNINNTAFSFLTPSRIYLPGDTTIKTITEKSKIKENLNNKKQQYKNAILGITKLNLGKTTGLRQEINPAAAVQNEKRHLNDILSKIGCTMTAKRQSIISSIDPNKKVSTTKNIIEEYTAAKSEAPQSSISLAYNVAQAKLSPKTKDSIKNYDLRDENTGFFLKIQNLMEEYEDKKEDIYIGTPHPIKSLPNAVKSILLASSKNASAGKINWFDKASINHPDENGYFYMNYKNIMRLEALTDIQTTRIPSKKTKKTSSINNMVWRTVTPGLLNTLALSGARTLCRLVPYENKDFNIKQEEGLALPIYNQYFLISFAKEKTNKDLDTGKALLYRNMLEYEKTPTPSLEYTFSEVITRNSVKRTTRTGGRSAYDRSPKSGISNQSSPAGSSGGGGMSGGGY